jgi:Rnl2 family RNA ligase
MTISLLQYPKISVKRLEAVVKLDDWVSSEKIHGAQLVVGADAGEVRIGKRKAWLEPDESFFGWQMLRPFLHAVARSVHQALGTKGQVWLYGELFGGCYPHSGVSAIPGLVPVQTGIWYTPDLQFAVFDIVHARGAAEPEFLSHDFVQELATNAGANTVPHLARGRFADLDRLPVRFPTHVPTMLGLPAITPNDAEGYVVKPAAGGPVSKRPAAKRKIAEFDERKFDESTAFDENAHLSRDELSALALHLVNDARVSGARSKVGTDLNRVTEEVVLDTMLDLRDMFPRRIEAMSPDEERKLLAALERKARTFIA